MPNFRLKRILLACLTCLGIFWFYVVEFTFVTTKNCSSTDSAISLFTSLKELLDKSQQKKCLYVPPLLKGHIDLNFEENNTENANWPPTYEEIAVAYPQLKLGGYYPGPTNCTARNRITIIVPYRDRDQHLRFFLYYSHRLLQRQQATYRIYVVEQDDKNTFNKGQLMNTAFQYAINQTDFTSDCYFFHDVDLFSEDDRVTYECGKENEVVHLAHRIDKFNYKSMCCGMSVGGVLGMSKNAFITMNGYSNLYYGWGAEDDEMYERIYEVLKGHVKRPEEKFAKFKMILHTQDNKNADNPKRLELLKNWKNLQPTDGLNSLNASISNVVKYKTHTRIYVKPTIEFKDKSL